ncbi:hypothetical protein P7H46_03445 [Enterococcus pseudoavium]|uniref:Uncharacterized protein n=1 Tax=Enterococcus pseudoavium TaxID=44007 RepID=A0ABU3FFT1_9ENTE|nr:hypothetical protein [Enterococcus pseudoavium]MDT2769893.1 hypothetical protein [Enterococcus pseudoavium]
MVVSKQKTHHNLNVFIYAYNVVGEQVGLPVNDDVQLVYTKPEPLKGLLHIKFKL